MRIMKKILAVAAVSAFVTLPFAGSAQAGGVFLGFNFAPQPVYMAPAPVVYAPPPAPYYYSAPAPVVVTEGYPVYGYYHCRPHYHYWHHWDGYGRWH